MFGLIHFTYKLDILYNTSHIVDEGYNSLILTKINKSIKSKMKDLLILSWLQTYLLLTPGSSSISFTYLSEVIKRSNTLRRLISYCSS